MTGGRARVLRRRGGALGELAEPDVAEPHRVVVVLEPEGAPPSLVGVREPLQHEVGPNGSSLSCTSTPLVEERHPRRLEAACRRRRSAGGGRRCRRPAIRRAGARAFEQGRILAVDRPRLAVGIGVGAIGIEHLDLELAHQEDAAVAAVLALTNGRIRGGPLDVELDVAELSLRHDRPGPRRRLEDAAGHLPAGGPAARRLPSVEVRPVEQDDGIPRRLRRDRAPGGLDHRRPRAPDVVLPPAGYARSGADPPRRPGRRGGQRLRSSRRSGIVKRWKAWATAPRSDGKGREIPRANGVLPGRLAPRGSPRQRLSSALIVRVGAGR